MKRYQIEVMVKLADDKDPQEFIEEAMWWHMDNDEDGHVIMIVDHGKVEDCICLVTTAVDPDCPACNRTEA